MALPKKHGNRVRAEQLKNTILEEGVWLAERGNYMILSRKAIAERVGCADAIISHHFGNVQEIRKAVVRHALAEGNVKIASQVLLFQDRTFMRRVTPDLREQVIASIKG